MAEVHGAIEPERKRARKREKGLGFYDLKLLNSFYCFHVVHVVHVVINMFFVCCLFFVRLNLYIYVCVCVFKFRYVYSDALLLPSNKRMC